jgi:hypothetical protein
MRTVVVNIVITEDNINIFAILVFDKQIGQSGAVANELEGSTGILAMQQPSSSYLGLDAWR